MWRRSALVAVTIAVAASAGGVGAAIAGIDDAASTDRVAWRTNPPLTYRGTDLERIAREMADLVNAERRAVGLVDLQWNEQVAEAAVIHAGDMAAREVLDHSGGDGSTVGDRVTESGYRWRLVGETIGSFYVDPQSLVDDWMSSLTHRDVLLTDDFYWFGAGVDVDARGRPYWVVVVAL